MKKQEKSPIDMILDEENDENIVLFDENNNETEFEQVAVIPMDDKTYVLLKPVELKKWEGIGEDEALVFAIEEIDDEDCLILEEDQKVIDKVFDSYYDMLRSYGIEIDEE